MRSIDDVIDEYRAEIEKLDGIIEVSAGMHLGHHCIMIYLEKENPEIQKEISRYIEGHPVRFVIGNTIDVF